MAKKKFIDRRRRDVVLDCGRQISAESKVPAIIDLVRRYGFEFEVHVCGDGYSGYMFRFDPVYDATWIIVKNPFAGPPLELVIDDGFGIVFALGCWLYPETENGFTDFCEMLKAIIDGRAASVSFISDGKDEASALLRDNELDYGDELRFLNVLAARDYWQNDFCFGIKPNIGVIAKLQSKLRRIRSRKAWFVEFKFWDPAKDHVVTFDKQ